MTIKYQPDGQIFKIMINDLPHVIFHRDNFLATRAYAEPPMPIGTDISQVLTTPKQYCIEFVMKGNSFICKYGDREIWSDILKILNEFI